MVTNWAVDYVLNKGREQEKKKNKYISKRPDHGPIDCYTAPNTRRPLSIQVTHTAKEH